MKTSAEGLSTSIAYNEFTISESDSLDTFLGMYARLIIRIYTC